MVLEELIGNFSTLSFNEDPAEGPPTTRSKATRMKNNLDNADEYFPKCAVCGEDFLDIPVLREHVKECEHRADKKEIKSQYQRLRSECRCAFQAWESTPDDELELKRRKLREAKFAYLKFNKKLLQLTSLERLHL